MFFGTTRAHYDNFLKDSGLRPVEESIGTDAKLLWIGPKRDDRVLLYLHGESIRPTIGEGFLMVVSISQGEVSFCRCQEQRPLSGDISKRI